MWQVAGGDGPYPGARAADAGLRAHVLSSRGKERRRTTIIWVYNILMILTFIVIVIIVIIVIYVPFLIMIYNIICLGLKPGAWLLRERQRRTDASPDENNAAASAFSWEC